MLAVRREGPLPRELTGGKDPQGGGIARAGECFVVIKNTYGAGAGWILLNMAKAVRKLVKAFMIARFARFILLFKYSFRVIFHHVNTIICQLSSQGATANDFEMGPLKTGNAEAVKRRVETRNGGRAGAHPYRRYAGPPIRRPADTSLPSFADTPIRRPADTFLHLSPTRRSADPPTRFFTSRRHADPPTRFFTLLSARLITSTNWRSRCG